MSEENKFYYKLILAYKGTSYSGWQFQTHNPKTVQRHVEEVLANIVNHQSFQVIGASRTDTGVHAKGQVLKIILPREISPEKLMMGMNSKLPNDIKVMDAQFCNHSLNVNIDSKSKEYHYYFSKGISNPINSDTILYTQDTLDLNLMKDACKLIEGSHDFKSFCIVGSRGGSTIRNIHNCTIEKTSLSPFEDEVFYLKIRGDGFLKYMVRILMGALFDIGTGKLTINDFSESLLSGEQKGLRTKVTPVGLHLINIEF